MNDFVLCAGTANPALAEAIAQGLGIALGDVQVERFPDGEVHVQLFQSVRHKPVFILQPTAPPVDTHLVELLAFVDACRRADAAEIIAILPYYGYGRSDRRNGREPIAASMVATCLQAVGVDHLLLVDPHTPQIEGFFDLPVDSLSAAGLLCEAMRAHLPENTVVVAPDAGRVKMATDYARRLGLPVIVLHKERVSGSETHVTHIVGDVRDRSCLLVDDMISTGGTMAESVQALLEAGARPDIRLAATHGLLLGEARKKLSRNEVREIYVTDTVAVPYRDWPALRIVPVAPLIASAIERFVTDGSLHDLS
ncbi:MAG TPA: ribose-phosphate pyrophosphokinase [Chthonomonadaceae bacterium]|nr:ribose-phosphate pyrophosphokinase [Chthonomonadaceae bacterium]